MKIPFAIMLFALLAASVLAQNSSGHKLVSKIQIGGEGGWDYLFVDSQSHRLYVSHATKVAVVDTTTNKVVGEITGFKGVHGIAVDAALDRGFISDGRDDSVTIFDTKTLKPVQSVRVGKNPDCIIYDPASKRVFAFNRGSSSVSAIDAASGKIDGTIDLGAHPEFAVSDGKGMIYVNLDDKSEVVPIDSTKLIAMKHWSVAPGEGPSGMAMDRKNRRLFIVCGNKKMIVLNADDGKLVADEPIGSGVDAVAFDEKEQLAFSSNGEGTMTIVSVGSTGKFNVLETVITQRGARTLALDVKTHLVYLATAEFGETPPPTAENPRPRPAVIPNSFVVLVFGKEK